MQILEIKLATIYKVFKAIKEKGQLLVSEAIAVAGSTAFYERYMPYLEENCSYECYLSYWYELWWF